MTYIIAEAGVNHNGSLDLARQLIDAAHEAGADAVKFQTFKAENLATATAAKADYQQRTTGAAQSQQAMLRQLELDAAAHRALIAHCQQRGITFLSSPFDLEALRFLDQDLRLPRLKLGSGEITNGPLLLAVAHTGKPLILSTGMATLGETEHALMLLAHGYASRERPTPEALRQAWADPAAQARMREQVTLLHCTTEYPAPLEQVHLRAMTTLRQAFGVAVGYSDHTPGITVPIAATALGATVIEKHFTLDQTLPGPDHRASLEPAQLRAMVQAIREVETALGDATKVPQPREWGNRSIARKSLIANQPIAQGERFTPENLGSKRPGHGISPMRYWEFLDTPAPRDLAPDEVL